MGLRKQQELSESEIAPARARKRSISSIFQTSPTAFRPSFRAACGSASASRARSRFGPKYILYDEPTTGLDPVTSAVIDQLMVRMREKLGVTGIVITHDMRSAYTVGTPHRDAV